MLGFAFVPPGLGDDPWRQPTTRALASIYMNHLLYLWCTVYIV